MSLIGDLRELLLPRLCPVCGRLLMGSEDVMCAFCAIQLPRHYVLDFDDNAMLRSIWNRADLLGNRFFSFKTGQEKNFLLKM